MSDIFDFESRNDDYAVMGNPIAHSKSPVIHSHFAAQTAEAVHYTAIQVDPGGFAQAVAHFQATGGKGLNITVPFKQEAWSLVDSMSLRAQRAGAVNTIKFDGNTLYGDNTDGIGLVNDLLNNNKLVLKNKNILLMGAGGASRGVIIPLLEQKPAMLKIVNRTADKALDLAHQFADMGTVKGSGYEALDGEQYDVVINATAASLSGEVPPLPVNIFKSDGVAYDMMYSAEPTAFLKWSALQGVKKNIDGLGMLVEQAAESFYLWRGVRPETLPVIEMLRQEIIKN